MINYLVIIFFLLMYVSCEWISWIDTSHNDKILSYFIENFQMNKK
jgi:hypothetical protein